MSMDRTRRELLATAAAGAVVLSGALGLPAVSRAQSRRLLVWWNRGYYREEDEAVLRTAQAFGKARNVDVDISFTPSEDLPNRLAGALAAGRVPDVAFCSDGDREVLPSSAWQGKLLETTDLVTELRPRYTEKLLPAAHVWNAVERKRAYYGVPIGAQVVHTHCWRDLLREAGWADEPDRVPRGWEEHWEFWKRAQDALRKKDPAKHGRVWGLGLTLSPRATDTLWNFDMALLSFGGQLLSDDGRVVAAESPNREAIVKTLQWLADLYGAGYVPPEATGWADGDNNASFHAKSVVMTTNPSLSIPAHQLVNAPDDYFHRTATVEWPDNPGGGKAAYVVAVRTLVVPKDARAADLAKEFIRFLLEPSRFAEYARDGHGRWLPAFTDVAKDPFFAKGQAGKGGPVDHHVPVATRIHLERDLRALDHTRHPGSAQARAENIWGKAMARMMGDRDKWPAEKAATEAIKRLGTIVAQWR